MERALMYWFVLRISYGGKFGSGMSASCKKNTAQEVWRGLEKLRLIHKRLKNVFIEQLDFRELIRKYDDKNTFFYVDPPHLVLSTELNKGKDYYTVAFTDRDYMDLLSLLENIQGKFLLKQSTMVPWLIEWAKKHKYSIRHLTLKKSVVANPRAKTKETYTLYFIANYKL